MATISVNQSICTKCGTCVRACGWNVFKMADGEFPQVDAERCSRCGHCVAACPTGAVNHGDFPLERCPSIAKEALPSYDSLLSAIKKRRSIRSFKEKAVPGELVDALMEASRFAPTGHNLQEVDWLAIDSTELLRDLSARAASALGRTARLLGNPFVSFYLGLTEGFEKVAANKYAAATLANLQTQSLAGEDPIFYHAPLLLVAHVSAGTYFGRDDAVHAVYNVELAAERLGLGSCLMGYFKIALDRDKSLRKRLRLPAGRSPEAALVIGYPEVEYLRALPRRRPSLLWIS